MTKEKKSMLFHTHLAITNTTNTPNMSQEIESRGFSFDQLIRYLDPSRGIFEQDLYFKSIIMYFYPPYNELLCIESAI